MSDDDIRTDPLPADVHLDLDRVPQLVGEAMIAADPDHADEIRRDLVTGQFGFTLEGWDESGFATVEVITPRDGRVAGWVRMHWSQFVS